MKRFGWQFLALLFAMQQVVFFAQAVERPTPCFSVSIKEVDPSTVPDGYPSDYHKLLVTYTNTSDAVEVIPSNLHVTLNMIVLHDGAPAEETKGMRALRKDRNDLASGNTTPSSVQMTHSLKPGASITFPWEISGYFNMSKPGTYTITVNRETYPWDPAKSVTVWSNTLTIVVPQPGSVAPQ